MGYLYMYSIVHPFIQPAQTLLVPRCEREASVNIKVAGEVAHVDVCKGDVRVLYAGISDLFSRG